MIDDRFLTVPDTMQALGALGRAARARCGGKFIGVTGSVGKTTAKEMLACALESEACVYATRGNLNNHIGVPLTLANLPAETEVAIIEMGMNHAGEITPLSQMVRPDVALITAVEAVHLEFFDSLEAIADAKLEICDGIGGGGTLLLPADHSLYEVMRAKAEAKAKGVTQVVGFGESAHARYRLLDWRLEGLESQVAAEINGARITYRLGTVGRHWALLSVAVLGVADLLGADLARAAEALGRFREPVGRGQVSRVALPGGGDITLIDDSYNASPVAMRAAFRTLHDVHAAAGGEGRSIAVLGDMLELGAEAETLHVGLAAALEEAGIDLVFASGPLMRALFEALPPERRGGWEATAEAVISPLLSTLGSGDTVLVKGSHGSRSYVVAEAIAGMDT